MRHGARHEMIVRPRAEKTRQPVAVHVAGGELPHVREQIGIGRRRGQIERALEPYLGGDVLEQLLNRPHPDRREHPRALRRGRGDVLHDCASPRSAP